MSRSRQHFDFLSKLLLLLIVAALCGVSACYPPARQARADFLETDIKRITYLIQKSWREKEIQGIKIFINQKAERSEEHRLPDFLERATLSPLTNLQYCYIRVLDRPDTNGVVKSELVASYVVEETKSGKKMRVAIRNEDSSAEII